MRNVRRRAGWLVLAVTLAAVGCGQAGDSHNAAAANKRAKRYLVSEQQLPENYREANGQESPGEVKLCDLTLKPYGVRGFAMKRYTYSVVGPFLYQYVFVASDDANRRLMRRLDRALQSCRKDAVDTEEGTKITFRVTTLRELPRFGQESTAFRRVPKGDGVASEYMLIRDGDVSVLLFTVAPKEISVPRELLVAGAEAVTRAVRED